MEPRDRDRRRTREHNGQDKHRKKTNRDRAQEQPEKDSTLPIDTETGTTSTYPEDSEYSERMHQKIEHRKLKERSHHRTHHEQRNTNHEQRNNDQEQKNNQDNHQLDKIEEDEAIEKNEKEKNSHRKHDKPSNDDSEKKRTKQKSEHKSSKEHREHKEGRRGTHQSPSRHRSEEKRNREEHEGRHKSRETYHIKSKSIAEKLDQLENSDVNDDMDKKNTETHNTSKQLVQKENGDRREDEEHGVSKHNQQKENNGDRKNEETEESKHERLARRHSGKCKPSLRDKLKRTVSENRENGVRHSEDSEHRRRQRKRTESHREHKKEKSCRKCKKHFSKPEPHRAYFSDSELDCANSVSRKKSPEATSALCEPPLDINAMYNAFTQPVKGKTTEDGEKIKESIRQKLHQSKKTEANLCEKCSKVNKKRTRSPTDQTSIRSKLISALFQRIKALLKETEELRQERNDLRDRLTTLTKEYENLREREELNSEQEQLMKEKIESIAGDIRIPNKGTFREEVHQILQNIQRKYQTHWKEHEHKINQVQTDAENEIQSLMRNIVTKYVEIDEIKCRNEIATNMLQSKNIAEPLYISTKTNSTADSTTRNQQVGAFYERYYPNNPIQSKNELLLKVAESTKPRSSNQQQSLQALCRENLMKSTNLPAMLRQGNHPVELNINKGNQQRESSMIPKFVYGNPHKYNFGSSETVAAHNSGSNRSDQAKEKLPIGSSPEDMKVHFNPTTTSEDIKLQYRTTKKYLPNENKLGNDHTTKTTEQGLLTKKDTREFWRQKLSQPASTDSAKDTPDNHRPIENRRNLN